MMLIYQRYHLEYINIFDAARYLLQALVGRDLQSVLNTITSDSFVHKDLFLNVLLISILIKIDF